MPTGTGGHIRQLNNKGLMEKKERGVLIVFEGIDGTGKSTQICLLEQFLRQSGWQVSTTREPTAGSFGQRIRELYRNRQNVTPEEECELFLSDRREHVDNCINPALEKGRIVLCDRYFLSTAAYQGAAGLDPQMIIERNHFAPEPDLAFIFEISAEESIKRITLSRGDRPNDFEQLDALKEVDKLFRSLNLPYIRRIDGTQAIEEISKQVRYHTVRLLDERYTTGMQ